MNWTRSDVKRCTLLHINSTAYNTTILAIILYGQYNKRHKKRIILVHGRGPTMNTRIKVQLFKLTFNWIITEHSSEQYIKHVSPLCWVAQRCDALWKQRVSIDTFCITSSHRLKDLLTRARWRPSSAWHQGATKTNKKNSHDRPVQGWRQQAANSIVLLQ